MSHAPSQDPAMNNPNWFSRAARASSKFTGRPLCFMLAVGTIVAWLASGPVFGFSDTWQLVINTGTTIITFLMVFLIQNTQNRDTEAMQIKLDEIIRATKAAKNSMIDLEDLDEETLELYRRRYEEMAERARSTQERSRQGRPRQEQSRHERSGQERSRNETDKNETDKKASPDTLKRPRGQ